MTSELRDSISSHIWWRQLRFSEILFAVTLFQRIAETVRLHGSYSQFTEIINYARISHQFLYSNTAFNSNVWRLKLQATDLKKKSLFIIHFP